MTNDSKTQWPKIVKIYDDDLSAVKRKYRQLAQEIERGATHQDLQHSVSKLGIFIEDMLGYSNGKLVWREIDVKK